MAIAGLDSPDILVLPAPAKLNLRLAITGRRHDGMHMLDTDMTLIDLCDEIVIKRRDDGQIRRFCRHPQVNAADDLCLRAARLLKAAAGDSKRLGAGITVRKKIPVGGGLGGGSSNAATVLLGLNKLWGLGWSRMRLAKLSATLGADLPFFFFGRPAHARGVGGDLTLMQRQAALTVAKNLYFLVFPPVSLITADVYAEYRKLTEAAKKGKMHPNSGNDLMAAAIRLFPQIADVAKKLRQAAGESRMSGSGACLFASFGGMKAALRARAVFGADFPVTIVGGLSHHPLGNMNAKKFNGE